ncbi:MAG: PIN domain-containing protein [Acidobacteriaceae bacterium]
MSDRFFLDTNIFACSFDLTAPKKAANAKRLIRQALESQKGVTSFQVVQEFFNLAHKRFVPPLKGSDAEQYLGTVFRPLVAVHSSLTLYSEALHIQRQRGFSWYDSLIVAAALQSRCDLLYSEDLQHGQRLGSLRIVNPFL